MANNEKIISQSVFEQAVKDILIELVNSTYSWESYSDEEIGNLVELDPTQVAELSAVINDSVSAKNKVYSSQYTKELIQQSLIESNKYSDDLVANLSNIKLDIVDSLPDSSTVNKSTIYILKDSTGGTNNTLNVWSDSASAFVEVGKLNVNMNNYYTKSEVDAELAKKANSDEVLKPDAIVSDLTTTSGSTTLSTAGLQTELDKKIDKTSILTAKDSSATDDQVYSAKAINTELGEYAKTVDLPTPRTDEEILAVINKEGLQFIDDANDTTLTNGRYATKTTTTNLPVSAYGILTVDKYKDTNSTWIKQTYKPLADQIYVRSKINSLEWTAWDRVTTNNIEKYQIKNYNNDLKVNNTIEKLEDLLKLVPSGQTWYIPDFNIDQTVTDYGFPEGARQWGTMTITNSISSGHYLIELQSNTNYQVEKRWIGETRHVVAGTNQPYQVKWQKLCTTSVADVPVTNIVPADKTTFVNFEGNTSCNYCVRNGICYVSLWGVQVASTGNTIKTNVFLPRVANVRVGTLMTGSGDATCHALAFVLDNGELCFDVKDANISLYGSFSYPVAES